MKSWRPIQLHEPTLEEEIEAAINLVRELGGNVESYRKQRASDARTIVFEVYSRPRVAAMTKMLPSHGILPGFFVDHTTVKEDGEPWDFCKEEDRQAARDLQEQTEPMFLVGSPPSIDFSSWQPLNRERYEW